MGLGIIDLYYIAGLEYGCTKPLILIKIVYYVKQSALGCFELPYAGNLWIVPIIQDYHCTVLHFIYYCTKYSIA